MVVTLALLAWLLLGAVGLLWISMYGAEPLPAHAAPDLHRVVRILADRAHLPEAPALYYLDSTVTLLQLGCPDRRSTTPTSRP